MLGQHFQRQSYNKGQLPFEFQEGDLVLLNLHSLYLLRNETGHGRKLLMKYDGPFEIIRKLSAVSYRLQMPKSYGIHPMLNIAHLEKYQPSPAKFSNRPTKSLIAVFKIVGTATIPLLFWAVVAAKLQTIASHSFRQRFL